MLTLLKEQPKPFLMIFMLEMWERFGFYTVQGILVLYFIRKMGLSTHRAYETFGAFSALIYVMVPLGGYLGDKWLGTHRMIVVGLGLLVLGYGCLALFEKEILYPSLGLICVGAALFKSNPGVLLAKCYSEYPQKLHAGFTLYYMSINLGSIIALIFGPYISHHYGYSYAYGLSAAGIMGGLFTYVSQYRKLPTLEPLEKINFFCWTGLCLVIVVLVSMTTYLLQYPEKARSILLGMMGIFVGFYGYCMWKSEPGVRRRLCLALILMLEAVVFFTLYQQMPTSITVFSVYHVKPVLLGLSFDPQTFQVLNPLWIVIMSPILALWYTYLHRMQIYFSVPYKFAVGMACCGLSFMILYLARFGHDDLGMVSPWWLVGSYFFQSLGELLVSALGLAMVAELISPKMMGYVVGMWFLTPSLAGFTGAAVASLTVLPTEISSKIGALMNYTHVFAQIGLVTLGISVILAIMAPRLTRMMIESEKSN